MTVEELEDLLARCPADLPVIVRVRGKLTAQHIEAVDRAPAGRFKGRGPALILGGLGTVWFEPAPPWVVHGPWRGRADLPWEPLGGWRSEDGR